MKFLKNLFSFFGKTKKRSTKRSTKKQRKSRSNLGKTKMSKKGTKRAYKMRGGG
jgi:hypothetical protein